MITRDILHFTETHAIAPKHEHNPAYGVCPFCYEVYIGENYDLCAFPIITDEIEKRGYVHAEPFVFTYEMFQAATPINAPAEE